MSVNLSDIATLAFDIGGANLKVYHSAGSAVSLPFALWKHPSRLADQLVLLAQQQLHANVWLITMTGELADCYRDRVAGVHAIVEHVNAAAARLGVDEVWFYGISEDAGATGGFVSAASALHFPYLVASANWHATAGYVAQSLSPNDHALVIDIGSTTTDLIPIQCGKVATESKTDFDRLTRSELVYVGGERTPVCSLVSELPWRGQSVAVMREFFADIGDCAIILGKLAAPPVCEHSVEVSETADGMPRTRDNAIARLARMIGLDHQQISADEANGMASAVVIAAQRLIANAIQHLDPIGMMPLLTIGHHRWLLSDVVIGHRNCRAVCEGDSMSRVGPAFALCELYQRQVRGTTV